MGYTNACKINEIIFSTPCSTDKALVKALALFGTWQFGKEVANW